MLFQMLYLSQKSRWCLYVGLRGSFTLWNYCFVPGCRREMSGFSCCGASQVVSQLMSVCSKASRDVELHWPFVTVFVECGLFPSAGKSCLPKVYFVQCFGKSGPEWGGTEWAQVSASLFVPFKTQLFQSSDLQLWKLRGSSPLVTQVSSFSTFGQLTTTTTTVGSLQSIWCFTGTKFDPKSPGKNSRQIDSFSCLSFNMKFEIHWSCQSWEKMNLLVKSQRNFSVGAAGCIDTLNY